MAVPRGIALLLASSFCFLCCGWALPAQERYLSKAQIEKANKFVDKLIADKREDLQKAIGKVKLPDQYFEFSKKIAFVDTHGFARLTHGRLDNLSDIKRKGNCVLTSDGKALSTVIDLGVDNVKGGYYIEVEFGVFSAASNLKVEIESVEIVLKGIQSFREIKDLNDEKDKILDFDVALNVKAYLGHIDVDVNMFIGIDWLLNFIVEKVVDNLKLGLQNMLKEPLRKAIADISGDAFFKMLIN